ncbi:MULTISPECIES: DUF6479 family protein [Streptomyces]|uniref:Secreted protein n=1 Tax=Streptomyces morookaense TaxID=1970 RepID=A0A7Y7E9F4_STRMO|nr:MULTISPECIES: DUF6479 family protein [Streptomyces]MCC2278463.1 syndecan [Streptomyces sp. ET3-23]NVK80371.1 hypothetical protein [Streptomyces morookaense]GHF10593.1 hypothetical protein GCM10010359_10170 [Streptomyces morookaense]
MKLALPAYLGGIAPFAVGLIVVILLIVAVAYGMRKRDEEPPPPSAPQRRMGAWSTPEEDGRPTPEHGPGHDDDEDAVGYVREHREPDPLQTEANGERVLPHEIRNPGSHPEEPSEEDKKWRPGGSGSFGSGGAGA